LSDPRAELVRQLLEYKKFKDAANLLDAAAQQQSERLNRPATIINSLKDDSEPELDLDQVSIWDLLESFDSILQATGATFDLSHIPDDTPIDLYQIEILHRLQTEGAIPFERLFESKTNRLAMVGLFLALLELVRDRLVAAEQQQGSEAIYLSALTDELAEQAVRNAILSASAEPEKPVESVSEPTKSAEPAIPITEIPAKEKTSAETVRWAEAPVPIEELPPESKRRTEPAQGPVSNHTADSDEPNDG
jgi:segregation and condensation protein A